MFSKMAMANAIASVLTAAEAHILKNFPDTITEKERNFLQVHLPKTKLTPRGETILNTAGQLLFE